MLQAKQLKGFTVGQTATNYVNYFQGCVPVNLFQIFSSQYTAMLLFCHTLPYLNSPSDRNLTSLSALMDLSGNVKDSDSLCFPKVF